MGQMILFPEVGGAAGVAPAWAAGDCVGGVCAGVWPAELDELGACPAAGCAACCVLSAPEDRAIVRGSPKTKNASAAATVHFLPIGLRYRLAPTRQRLILSNDNFPVNSPMVMMCSCRPRHSRPSRKPSLPFIAAQRHPVYNPAPMVTNGHPVPFSRLTHHSTSGTFPIGIFGADLPSRASLQTLPGLLR